MLLPPSEKARVAQLWELVDDGAGFDEVLDALISSGLRELPGFVLVSEFEADTKVVIRGAARASFTADSGPLELEGSTATTWVERSLTGVTGMVIEVGDDDTDGRGPPDHQRPGPGGPGRRAAVRAGAEPDPRAGAERLGRYAAEPRAGAADPPFDDEPDDADDPGSDETEVSDEPECPTSAVDTADARGRGPVPPIPPVPADPAPPTTDHDGMTRAGSQDPGQFAPQQPGIPGQPPAPSITRPVARLVFSSGQTVEVDRATLVGRAPEARRFPSTEQPRLVTVPSPHHEISSTHLEVRPGSGADHGSAVVVDLGSTNGTVLVQPGLPPEDLQAGIAVQLIPGAIIDLGDGVTIQVMNP